MVATTRVFQSGNSQAVRLPKEFRLHGPEVEIYRRGDEIVIRDLPPGDLGDAFAILADLPFQGEREDAPAQERDDL